LQDMPPVADNGMLRCRLSFHRAGGCLQEGRTPFPLSDVRPSLRRVLASQDRPTPACMPAPTACRGDRHHRSRASQCFHP
jgi:hypothetical protein